MSLPSVRPVASTARPISSNAARLFGRSGAKPPSSPKPVAKPSDFNTDFSE